MLMGAGTAGVGVVNIIQIIRGNMHESKGINIIRIQIDGQGN
jgi:hypothetical protein